MSNHFESHEDFAQPRLIPRLRAIQESSGYLPRPKLEALSTELGIPLHKIHEIVSFFPQAPVGRRLLGVRLGRGVDVWLQGNPHPEF